MSKKDEVSKRRILVSKGTKESKLELKNLKVGEADYRGILAVTSTLGYFALVGYALASGSLDALKEVVSAFGTTWALIVAWYFQSKKKG